MEILVKETILRLGMEKMLWEIIAQVECFPYIRLLTMAIPSQLRGFC